MGDTSGMLSDTDLCPATSSSPFLFSFSLSATDMTGKDEAAVGGGGRREEEVKEKGLDSQTWERSFFLAKGDMTPCLVLQ